MTNPSTAALLLAGLCACGGGTAVQATRGGPGTISGLVVKGPVQSATVTAYPIDSVMNRGAALASAPSAPDGTFSLSIPPYNGALEVVAFGGSYPEEAVGVPVQLTHELSTVVPAFQSGSSFTVTVSPVSSIVRSLAKAAVGRGAALADAQGTAWTHVNSHFGGLDWRSIVPTNLTPSQPATVTMSDETKAALILAGISQAARTMAETSSLSPGTSVTGGTLAGAGADDASDGTLDGAAGGTALVEGSVPLTGQTFRRDLGQAIVKFVGSPFNKTQLVAADVMALANGLAADGDPYLFCPNQTAAPGCAGGPLDLQPPSIAVLDAPSFVSATVVTLRVQATDPIATVTAVYAQTVSGSPIAGTLSGGVWTLADIPLVEGPNLIYVWGVDGAGTGSAATATQVVVTRDTLPPSPYVNALAVSYYDERPMTLASAAVPGVYQFPSSATKAALIAAGGIWKASTRLGWTTPPTPTILEGPNPDNVPFVQVALPVGPGAAPTAVGTFSISVGSVTVSGDILPWKSPSSTTATEYYDIPISSSVAPALAVAALGPVAVTVSASFTDAAGNSGATGAIPVTLHVIGPPLVVEEDLAFSSYADPKSTYPYKLANNTYGSLFDAASGTFQDGQVRLVRYLVKNPATAPAAFRPDLSTSPSAWSAIETWGGTRVRLNNRIPSTSGNCLCPFINCTFNPWLPPMDGFSFTDCVQSVGDTCAPAPESQSAPPTPTNITGWYTHVAGDTATKLACKPQLWYAGAQTVAASSLVAQAFAPPAPTAGEATAAPSIGTFSVVPPAAGSSPGAVVLYLSRPLTAPRSVPLGTWNQFTSGSRYEAKKGYVYIPDSYTVSSTYVSWYFSSGATGWIGEAPAYQEIGFVTQASETIDTTLTLTTQGTDGTSLLGESATAFATSVSRSLVSH